MAFVSSKGSHAKGGAHAAGKTKGAAASHTAQPSREAPSPGRQAPASETRPAQERPPVRRQQVPVKRAASQETRAASPEPQADQWRQIPVGRSPQGQQVSSGQRSAPIQQVPSVQRPAPGPQTSSGQSPVRPVQSAQRRPAQQAAPVVRERTPARSHQEPIQWEQPRALREKPPRPPRERRPGLLGRVLTALFLLAGAAALALVFFLFGVFRVSYVLPDGSRETEYVLRGHAPENPPEAVLDGYTFTGWTGEDGGTVLPEKLAVYSDRVLTARMMPLLSSWDHGAYLTTDENGLIHPDDPMLRREAAEILRSFISVPVSSGEGFSDADPGTSWGAAAGDLKTLGAVSGDRFRPEDPVTLRELLCMAVQFYPVLSWEDLAVYPEPPEDAEPEELPDRSGPDPEGNYTLRYTFADVSQLDPDYARFCTAAAMGWVDYGPEVELDANHVLTRAQAAAFFNRIMGRGQNLELRREQTGSILDLPPSHPLYNQVMEAAVPHSGTLTEMGEVWENSQPFTLDLPSGFFFLGTQLYCMGEDGYLVTDETVDGFTFGPDGKYTSGMPELDELVQQVLGQIIEDGMTDMEKLRAAYNYTRDSFTYVKGSHYKRGDVSWAEEEAYAMFSTGHGNCYNFAGAFYELARALGQDAKLVSGLYGTNYLSHAWVEFTIDGERRLCDPEVEWTYLDNPELTQPDMFMMTVAYSNRWKYTV